MRARRPAGLLAVPLLLAATVGCGRSDGGAGAASTSAGSAAGTGTSGSAAASTVTVKNFAFGPATITVPTGTTVTWDFEDPAAHNVDASDGSFKSPDLKTGKTYQQKFDKPGTYQYICGIHQYMTGTVKVT